MSHPSSLKRFVLTSSALYLFNYLDRASIGQARISTLQEDINLTDSQFSTAVSILSYGYVPLL
jgi:hypothetical protein